LPRGLFFLHGDPNSIKGKSKQRLAVKNGVIPQNFLFGVPAKAGKTKENLCGIRFGYFRIEQEIGFRINSHSFAAAKEWEFSGMTRSFH